MTNHAMYKPISTDQWNAILERIISVLDTNDLAIIVQLLGSSVHEFSAAYSEHIIPDGWRIRMYELYGVCPLWLITGEGPKTITDIGVSDDFKKNLGTEIMMIFSDIVDFEHAQPMHLYAIQKKVESIVDSALFKSAIRINKHVDKKK